MFSLHLARIVLACGGKQNVKNEGEVGGKLCLLSLRVLLTK